MSVLVPLGFELRVVKGVEEFKALFQLRALRELRVFIQSEVEVVDSATAQRVSACVAERTVGFRVSARWASRPGAACERRNRSSCSTSSGANNIAGFSGLPKG